MQKGLVVMLALSRHAAAFAPRGRMNVVSAARMGSFTSQQQPKSLGNRRPGQAGASCLPLFAAVTTAAAVTSVASSASASNDVELPPKAEKIPHTVIFGAVSGENRGESPMSPPKFITDDYFWMRDDDRKNEKVLSQLRAENSHTEASTSHLASFREELYEELKGHVKQTDSSTPVPRGAWQYYQRTVDGLGYKIHCRQPRGYKAQDIGEEVVLDENELAKANTKSSFTAVSSLSASPSHELLAYTVDTEGGETFDLVIKRIGGDEISRVEEVDGGIVWGGDDSTIFYLKMDDQHRPFQVWRHKIGNKDDELIFEEKNELFWVDIDKTLDSKFLVISTASSETSEVLTLDLSSAGEMPSIVAPRRFKVKYNVDHRDGTFYIVTNDGGSANYKLVTAPVDAPGPENWKPLALDGGGTVFGDGSDISPGAPMLEDVSCFKDFLVMSGRAGGFTKVWVANMNQKAGSAADLRAVQFPDEACECGVGPNAEFESPSVRLDYSSLVSPPSTLDYDPAGQTLTLVKQKEVPNYDPTEYGTARIQVTATDGAKVPVSLVFHKSLVSEDGLPKAPAPMHLYGYGSYGMCMDPYFSFKRLPLLNRGVVYAVAHIRGGSEMGSSWYEDQGKYLAKRNTFSDFVSCAETLQGAGWSTPLLTSTEGRSAGGLLMGAVLNMRPDLFKVAIAGVPFVDVMVTMCDASIPLTVGEWEEWGNPNENKFFHYMNSYSPMQNVVRQAYPSILVTAGLHDPRVQYWEPMKWVSKLRDHKTDSNPLLLKVDLEAGHFSASDRYKYLRESAFDYAFLLDQLGLKDQVLKTKATASK